jgi:hypothetical protein
MTVHEALSLHNAPPPPPLSMVLRPTCLLHNASKFQLSLVQAVSKTLDE